MPLPPPVMMTMRFVRSKRGLDIDISYLLSPPRKRGPSKHLSVRIPLSIATTISRVGYWVPAFAGTTAERLETNGSVALDFSIPGLNLAEHHVDRLHLGVAQKLVDPFLAAEAGVLQAAERRAVEVP